MKTVAVAFQLRVPKGMKTDEIKEFVNTAIRAEPGIRHPGEHGVEVRLYKDRIEVFMP